MISVIVIGRNEGERLSRCMESVHSALGVLAQEIVYVDSQSADDSLARAKACGARCFLLSEEKTTAGLGRLVGAKEAQGEYLLFLDGDKVRVRTFGEPKEYDLSGKNDLPADLEKLIVTLRDKYGYLYN